MVGRRIQQKIEEIEDADADEDKDVMNFGVGKPRKR